MIQRFRWMALCHGEANSNIRDSNALSGGKLRSKGCGKCNWQGQNFVNYYHIYIHICGIHGSK